MAKITAAEVNKLRQTTGAGMMDCKKALVEAEGDFDKAIETLSEVNFNDELIATIALGGIGDAYLQKGDLTKAGEYYDQAYRRRDNELTSPLYMMKLAFTQEMNEDYDKAQKVYQELVEKYPTSPLSITAEKYLESLKLGGPVYKPVYQEE